MDNKRLITLFAIIFMAISAPFVIVHLLASPDDAPISTVQRVVAALANYFGPWGVAVVRLVDFPNAGLRSFSWALAVGLTLTGGLLLFLLLKIKRRGLQIALTMFWSLFVAAWFAVGLRQIADGLL